MKKELNSSANYKKTLMKTKIKSYTGKNTGFHDQGMFKVDSSYVCVAVILIDFSLKNDQNYYSQVFLKECIENNCKYTEKEKYITDALEIYSGDSDKKDSERRILKRNHLKGCFLGFKVVCKYDYKSIKESVQNK